MADKYIQFPCTEVSQPIGRFYIGMMEASEVCRIAHADVRRLEHEKRDVETYLGIQRPLEERRVKEIAAYVRTVGASFPTSILLHVNSDDVSYDQTTRTMSVKDEPEVAKVLDGQHRIAGLEGYDGKFQLNVVLFVDMDIEDQAGVFATINLAQTKVNKSLVYDLFEYSKQRSPQKTCHQICRILDRNSSSPFYKAIRILGVANKAKDDWITQATFVEQLLKYVSSDPNRDRDLIKRNKPLPREPDRILRQFFVDKDDAGMGQVIWNYFDAVKEKWPNEWGVKEKGNLLSRSTGFIGFMRFFGYAYREAAKGTSVPTAKDFGEIFGPMTLSHDDFTVSELQYGSGGQKSLYDKLMEQTRR